MMKKPSLGTSSPRRPSSRYITTRSGKVLRVNRNLGERWVARKEAKSRRKVERMKGLPKSRVKRLIWRLDPKRQAAYWFSRDGGIMALKITGVGILVLFLLAVAVFSYFRKDLPNVSDISGSNLGGSISYYDRTGKILLWQDYSGVKRVPVAGNNISKYVKDATIATEDRNFYNERGFDIKGIIRSAYVDIFHRGSTQGGSTITQQLVKLTQDFGQTRSLSLKAKELILAVELERTYSKDQILTGYLNAAPYGSVDYGVQAAASDYFHKSAKDLTLPEAAMLAAIPKSPAYYSPYDAETFDKQLFVGRYNYVLDSMVQTGKITKAQATAAKKVDVLAEVQPQQTKYAGIQAPYFVLAAKSQLTTQFAPGTTSAASKKVGGWKVITTLDMTLQTKAEQVVQSNYANASRYGADEEAVVLEDVKTGQYEALVGGTDFNNADHGQINYAHDVKISPGSSFKPYDYSTLIDNNTNVGAGSVLYDSQTVLPGYPCTDHSQPPPKGTGNCLEDYDFRFPGPETLRYALGGSRNVPAVKAMLESVPNDSSPQRTTSINKVITTADALMSAPGAYQCYTPGVDITTATVADQTQCYGASAIGDGAYFHLDQHVNGLASLARMGNSLPPTYILNITDSSNKTIYQWKQPKGTQVIRQDAAYIVDNMASDPSASYLPAGFYKWQHYNGWTSAIKTGTTNNGFDGLMMSWNTQFAVGSWVGYHTRNQPLSNFMEILTTPLTRGLMTFALDNLHTTPVNWTEPSGIQHLPAFVVTTHVGEGSVEPSPSTDIYPSWYKQKGASSTNQPIDKVSNKLATTCTPAAAKETLTGNSAPNTYSIDIFYPPGQTASASSANTSASDDVHSCSDTQPSIDSFFIAGNPDDLTNGGTASCSGSCTITTNVSAGTHPFNDTNYPQYPGTVNLLVNGQVVQSQAVSDPSDTATFTYTGSGSVTIAVQVVDSVLYTTTSGNATVTVTASSPITIKQPTNGSNPGGGSVTVMWSGGNPNYTVSLNGTAQCTGITAMQCSISGIPNNQSSTIKVIDDGGDSAQITVTRP